MHCSDHSFLNSLIIAKHCPWRLASVLLAASAVSLWAAATQDESKVPAYELPDPLLCQDGAVVSSAAQWRETRRPELLKLFESEMYGRTLLARPDHLKFVLREEQPEARGGRATRLRVGILFEGREEGRQMELLVYLPNDVPKPAPLLLGLNFDGNYTVIEDPDLPLPKHWAMGLFANKLPDHRPTEAARGMHRHEWQIDNALEQGLGVATAAYGEIEPDEPGKWKDGIRGLGPEPGPGDWGAIGAWAWGLSRALDYLETNPRIDPKRIGVMGFSRLGKAALWAAVQDERFALVMSNQSGAGGAALSKRLFGEDVETLTTKFPHWFAGQFAKYANNESALPMDQHELLALLAPRPVLITSAEKDLWSDPQGEFLSAIAANPVFRLLGGKGLTAKERPSAGKLSNGLLGYFTREGGHEVFLEDWDAMVSFADKHLPIDTRSPWSLERYGRRLRLLPGKLQADWKAYFEKSDAARRLLESAQKANLDAAKRDVELLAPDGDDFEIDPKKPDDWFSSAEAKSLLDALLSYQLPTGGWSKHIDYSKGLRQVGMSWTSQGHAFHYAGTFDNGSTTEQLKFLMRCHQAHPQAAVQQAVERGIDYVLAAQFPNGGWPQCFPLEGGYHDALTLNDNALINILEFLAEVKHGEGDYAWIDAERRKQAAAALERGHRALLVLQVKWKGQATVWCAQYDLLSLQPVAARRFEPAALSGGESVEVVRYLMSLPEPTPEVIASIESAVAWFSSHRMPPNAEGKALWARFYTLAEPRPIFPGKWDGCWHSTLESLKKSNPTGYDYESRKPEDLIGKWVAKWRKKHGLDAPK